MTTCYLDIETLPTRNDTVIADIAASVTPPGSIKKAETLEKWEVETRPGLVDEAVAKTSFDPARGSICTISWAIDDGVITTTHDDTGDMEAEVLRAFFGAVYKARVSRWVGHFITGFDLRFLLCRAVVLGVQIPPLIPRNPAPWEKTVFDTMTAWAGARGSISLDNLAKALGIEGKAGVDGSMIAGMWREGRHQEIVDYCEDDVRIVREIYRRFQAAAF